MICAKLTQNLNMLNNPLDTPEMKAEIAQLHENLEEKVVQVECDSCHEMEDEDSAHSYGDATFCDSCYEGCIA